MGGLSMEWKEVTLGDFMQCNPKRTIKKGQKARKITMDLLIPHSKTIRNWNYEPYSGGAKFQNGDTIMARITPCLENGKHAFVSILDEGEIAYGSTEYFVFCGKEKVSDNDFVYYLTKTPLFRDTAIKSMVGSSGRQRAQMDVLENLKMFVPKDISDQRRIASILSSLDRKIELNNKINADLEEMAQAIFKNWFVDFEPFKDGKFVDSELGMIPEGWKVGTLGEFCKCLLGGTPSRSKEEYWNGEVNWINSGEINKFRILEASEKITELGLAKSATKLLPKKTTVLAITGATLGQVSLLEIDTCANQSVIGVLENTEVPYEYIYPFIKDRIEMLIQHQTGGAQQHINKDNVESLIFLLPAINVLEDYISLVSPMYKRIESQCFENLYLSTLRDTLLPRLMSGELEVPE